MGEWLFLNIGKRSVVVYVFQCGDNTRNHEEGLGMNFVYIYILKNLELKKPMDLSTTSCSSKT